MRLADDHIEITLGGELITLRPTLHCGFRLERREGSFAQLIADLQESSLSAAHFVLAPHFNRPTIAHCILDEGLDRVCGKLVEFILQCAGIDPTVQLIANDTQDTSPQVTFGEHLTNLYRIATGWIGWTPEIALDCTPTEITEAYKGRMEMLKAVFGGSDDKPTEGVSATDIRGAFDDLVAKQVNRRAK